jgi:hypothetical protein
MLAVMELGTDAAGDVVQFDHVMFATHDPERLRTELAEEWGLYVHPDFTDFGDGVSSLVVPLQPPQYLELLYVRDEVAFADTDDAVFDETLGAGGGLVGVVLRTWELAAVSEVLRQPLTTGPGVDESAPWRLVSNPGTGRYPDYIQYSASPRRLIDSWRQRLNDVAHRVEPGGIVWAEVSGAVADLTAWLAPAQHLDIRVRDGLPGVAAAIKVGDRLMLLTSSNPDPAVVQ